LGEGQVKESWVFCMSTKYTEADIRRMAARSDYSSLTNYERRLVNGFNKGLSRSQSRGHGGVESKPLVIRKTIFKKATETQINRKRNENSYAEKMGMSITAVKKDPFFRYNANLATVDLKRLDKMEGELTVLEHQKTDTDEEKAAREYAIMRKTKEIHELRASLGETYRNLGRKRGDDLTILGGSPPLR